MGAKPVIYCGDLNVARRDEDLARPKENEGMRGFTNEERAGLEKFIEAGFVDTFKRCCAITGFFDDARIDCIAIW